MKKGQITSKKLEKEDVRQAVIVDYKSIGCKSPEQGKNKKPFIQYSLEWLLIEKFEEVFICCLPKNAEKLREFVKNFIIFENVPPSMTIQVHSSEHNASTGDCLRDLDAKALIKTDFIIMDVGCCGNLPLAELLETHKQLKKVDKNAMMTSIVRNVFTKDPEVIGEFPVYVTDSKSGRLLHYVAGRVSVDNPNELVSKNAVEVPTDIILEHDSVMIYNNLTSTNLSIYSANVPLIFADLFDCSTEASLIQGSFDNQEVLGSTIYIHVVNDLFSQHMADMGFVINQKRDHFDPGLIYKRSNRHDTIRQLANRSLIGCTRLNRHDYICNLPEEEEEIDNESDSDDESMIDENEVFFNEVLESLVRGYEEQIDNDHLKLEVNSSKHAYNISKEDMYQIISRVLLLLPLHLSTKPSNSTEYASLMDKIIKRFTSFLSNYYKNDSSKEILLNSLEEVCLDEEIEHLTDGALAKVFYSLYEVNILDEKSILKWHTCEDLIGEEGQRLRQRPGIKRLAECLAEDDEDDDDDDEDDDDDDDIDVDDDKDN